MLLAVCKRWIVERYKLITYVLATTLYYLA
jgi:hypothetical protein